jgi:benzodiazapine receptor
MSTRDTVGSVAGVVATAGLGSVASSDVGSPWYVALRKPAFQPPGQVFGVVWTILYTDVAATSAVVLDRLGHADRNAATAYRRALAVNLVLNASWSWVFFKGHRLLPATVVAGVLALSSIDLARRGAAASPAAAVALTPYAAWCSFATVLSATIWQQNR